jgi:antitoxin component YwqK of YwqJK toxin-antitoxin module
VKRFLPVLLLLLFGFAPRLCAQGSTRQTFHDKEKQHPKEVYQVKDTVKNIAHGRYISYYLNGNVESKGQFTNNETTGVWEFFYETGNLKMRGILFKGANYGLWEYFYESGRKSMEGIIYGRNREGEWKTYYENGQLKEVGEYVNNKRKGLWLSYFEDGVKKGEIDYSDDFGTFTEYYHSGKVLGTGPKSGIKNVGHWRFFAEDGTLMAEGEYAAGKRNGEWINYYPSGKVLSKGKYNNDVQVGQWEYFYESGLPSSTGSFVNGQKHGYWKTMNSDGSVKHEVNYSTGSGEYREYYASGKLKVKGKIIEEKKEGKWEYFYEDGKKEGECEFVHGKGTYHGYYPNGNLQTKGTMEGDLKTGTWEIYANDGKLSGYYRPFYDDRKIDTEIAALTRKSSFRKSSVRRKRLTNFDERVNEFRGVILGGNPFFAFGGRFPIGIEFYNQDRLGHEFEFVGIRDPFFEADMNVAPGKQFERGYSIAIKQKLYSPLKAGMWYVGHEIRFTNFGHFVNVDFSTPLNPDNIFTASAIEQRFEWGLLLGYRIMQRTNSKGFTIDAFISGDIGYRKFDLDQNFYTYFEDFDRSNFSRSVHFGFNFGKVFGFAR